MNLFLSGVNEYKTETEVLVKQVTDKLSEVNNALANLDEFTQLANQIMEKADSAQKTYADLDEEILRMRGQLSELNSEGINISRKLVVHIDGIHSYLEKLSKTDQNLTDQLSKIDPSLDNLELRINKASVKANLSQYVIKVNKFYK